jgi:carbamoyltransferase
VPRNPLIVLGLNAFGHDAAAVLLVDGRVAFAASEERFDRVRHSAAFPARAAAAALAAAGLSPRDVGVVAFPWTRGMARARKALHVLRGWPHTRAFLREPPDDLLPDRAGYLLAMRGLVGRVRALGIDAPVRRVPHHVAHAASAALVLPGATGAVVTADGMGEWTTAATWDVRGGRPRRLRAAAYPHSPGKAYAAVTRWLGFRPEADEGKTMGLAAYGDPDAPGARFARGLLAPDARALLRVDLASFSFPRGEARLYGDAFDVVLGRPARSADEPLRPGDADVARGIQDAVEAFALEAARSAVGDSRAGWVGLAGGLFLNCAMNGRLARELGVPVLPFPVAGDAGAAWGAASLAHLEATGRAADPLGTLRLGTTIDDAAALRADAARGGALGPPLPLPRLAAEVARRIANGRLVGVARGRAELGPRALGGRSVLARADDPTTRDRLNDQKGRERWRPVAPVLRAADVPRWFEDPRESPWMITTLRARAAARSGALAGAVHADGTARVQTVGPDDEPFLDAVLAALAGEGHAAVVNTSLNRRGEPIVDTADQAVEAALAMRLDALVLGDRLWDLPGAETKPPSGASAGGRRGESPGTG